MWAEMWLQDEHKGQKRMDLVAQNSVSHLDTEMI